jgi:atypical dual specificity phosphatase
LYKVLDRDPHFPQRYILYGEWLYATHSIAYTNLPDRFLAFDIYDRATGTFADRKTLTSILAGTSIYMTPMLHEGDMLSGYELTKMVQGKSHFYEGRMEGAYVQIERNGLIVNRGKVVRGDFLAGNEHWSKAPLHVNGLALENDC